jgi:hypothetical protein
VSENELQWYFAALKGSTDDDVTEGKLSYRTSTIELLRTPSESHILQVLELTVSQCTDLIAVL